MLTIIIEHSATYHKTIEKLCKASGVVNYTIADPMSHDINKGFKNVLMIGYIRAPKLKAQKIWQTEVPLVTMSPEEKNKVFTVFKEIGAWMKENATNLVAKRENIPPLKTLNEFFNTLNGEVVELVLDDGRLMGIYPDGDPLKNKYDVEYHASIILNLSRINDIFDVKKIIVKEN